MRARGVAVAAIMLAVALTALVLCIWQPVFFQAEPFPEPSRARAALATCPGVAEDQYLFPDATFLGSDLRRRWYSSMLRAMGEPSLSCGVDPDGEIYRFLWLRSFHHPIAIRVTLVSGTGSLVAVELNGAGGYEPGSVLHRIDRRLASRDVTSILANLHDVHFWGMTQDDPRADSGTDGAQWILEGRRGRAYHLVDRWSPEPDSALAGGYRQACLRFLRLSGWSVPSTELY